MPLNATNNSIRGLCCIHLPLPFATSWVVFFHLFSWLISSDFILFIGKHLYLIMEFSTQGVNLIIYCFYLYSVIPELHAKVMRINEMITKEISF